MGVDLGFHKFGRTVLSTLAKVAALAGMVLLAQAASVTTASSQQLVVNNVGAPSVFGTGQGKRAIWTNAGTVGATTVDIVAEIISATLDHTPSTQSDRPAITSAGQDQIWVRWYLYQAGTYNLTTNSGGVPVTADIHVQFNDVDGPNNERVNVPVCAGDVAWLRIASNATTGRAFGTVGAYPETFTLIGDNNYNSEPESGVEVSYPNRSNFLMGRTANSGFFIRLDNPTYSAFTTYDFNCGDFVAPVANDDNQEGTPGSPAVLSILNNDTNATANDNPTNNGDQLPSEFGKLSVNLVPPGSATSVVTDGQGDVVSFTVPGEGDWSYNDTNGELTFSPLPDFKGYAATVDYTYDNALGQTSNAATVTVWYPAIGVVKSSTFNDESGDGDAQVGETITYQYALTAYGSGPLQNVSLTETGFGGAGVTPTPSYQSGDLNSDSRLDLNETWIYSASYTLVAGDLATGSVSNQATATAQTMSGKPLSDLSDSSNPADGNGTGTPGPGPDNDDPTGSVLPDAPIVARNDTIAAPLDGSTNQTAAINLLTDNGGGTDTLNGAPATPATVTTSPSGTVPPGFTVNADGTVDLTATIAPGPYSFDYRICESLNATNCDTATVTLTIGSTGIGIVKSVGFNDENSDGYAQVGETLSYTYVVTNTGSIALTGVTVSETTFTGAGATPVPALQGGDANSNARLDPSETWTYTADYTLVAADLAAGTVSNQATASGAPQGGSPVSDLSDSTRPADGNGTGTPGPGSGNDDPTTLPLPDAPIVAVNDTPPAIIGGVDRADFANVLTNDTLNGAPATAISVTTTVMTPATPTTPGAAVPTLNPINGNLSSGSSVPSGSYAITYRICEIVNATNCDDAIATVVVDAPVVATNDTVSTPVDSAYAQTNVINVLGNDTIGTTPASPATVTLAPVGSLPPGVTLNPDGSVDVAQFTPTATLTFDYRICETGNPANCDTATVTIPVNKSVPSISGTVFLDNNSNEVFNPGTDPVQQGYIVELMQGGTVVKSTISAPDGTYELRDFTPGSGYMIVFRDPASGVSVGAITNLTFGPATLMANQDQPIDPRGVIYSSATGLPIAGAAIQMTTAGGTPLPAACLLPGQQGQVTGADGAYRFDVVAGASAQCPPAETEYRLAVTSAPGHDTSASTLAPPQPGALDATTCPGDAVPGGDCQLSASPTAPPAGAPTPYYLAFLLAPGDPDVTNNHIPLDLQAAVTASGLSVIKTAARPVVERGGLAPYTITISNTNFFAVSPVDMIDMLPAGFLFTPGSATVNGASATPAVDGRAVRFAGLSIPARGSLVLTLSARVPGSATPGDYVNHATLIDPATGAALAPAGTATVRIEIDHVFDCGDVIGKVFDDRNHNGAQDGGETGLPGVRLATVNGMLITTDKHGRYNVPCAALPDASRGSNFILKLDTRSLPTGFSVTTENPRVVRLTRGKSTKINFGATMSRVISMDLGGQAFSPGRIEPRPGIGPVLDQVMQQLDRGAGILRLTYHARGDSAVADRRLAAVEKMIRARWKRRGSGRLSIERRIVGGG